MIMQFLANPWGLFTREAAAAAGFTHEGKVFGVPVWIRFDPIDAGALVIWPKVSIAILAIELACLLFMLVDQVGDIDSMPTSQLHIGDRIADDNAIGRTDGFA